MVQDIGLIVQWCGQRVPKRDIVKVVLSKQQREILRQISEKLGQSESEVLRMAFMEYARSISLINRKKSREKYRNQYK